MKYADVIIPLKFRDSVTYSIPGPLETDIIAGSIVKVSIVNRSYTAVVIRIKDNPEFDPGKIKPIDSVVGFPPVTLENMEFLKQVASYYMCSLGEAFRFAAPSTVKALKREIKHCGTDEKCPGIEYLPPPSLPVLSPGQAKAAERIKSFFRSSGNVLLHGVTGSGKTEIYITLAAECLQKGMNVLYLVPEIAMSRQIQKRLNIHFKDHLLVYHSKQTPAHKRKVYEKVASNGSPYILLGLRSSLFLPFRKLGLVIVDEEHDQSYKQTDQAPRYHGRDTALILGRIMQCPVLLGSATPSFESLYNVSAKKLGLVTLGHKYYEGKDCSVTIVDMRKERRKNAVKGPFSTILLKAIASRLEKHEQVLIFRSRRAYASAVECESCGTLLKCPRCNIPLSYHKFNNTLQCHYCGYGTTLPEACPECGNDTLKQIGDGTEKIEETLHEFFPEAKIERFDADTAKGGKAETGILKRFAEGETDILVGTQMISKGFDFNGLTLTAVLKAETITSVFDFRADERALQLLTQLMGRAGRRNAAGEMIVQTNCTDHPVFRLISGNEPDGISRLIEERREFGYPPYTRIIRITFKSDDKKRTESLAAKVKQVIPACGFDDVSGPAAPPAEKAGGEYRLQFIIKTDRNRNRASEKERLLERLKTVSATDISIDVDPVS